MKKLHSLAFCAMVTPVITFGAVSVMAQQPMDRDMDRSGQHNQRDQTNRTSSSVVTDDAHSTKRAMQSDSRKDGYAKAGSDKSRMKHHGYIDSAPAAGMHASQLIGADVKTTGDDDVGSVSDLVIDKNGHVIALVIGVGGVLGMGEKDVAIGWDDVRRSGTSDDHDLRIDVTQEDLRAAPEFETPD